MDGTYFHWLEEVITQLELPQQRVFLAGISLGGWIATGFVARHPENVEKLVLLCPSGIGRQKKSILYRAVFYLLFGERGQEKMLRYVYGSQTAAPEALAYSRIIARHFNTRIMQIPIYTDDELRSLSMPVLLIAGGKDVLLHSDETMHRVKTLVPYVNAEYIPDAGHVLIGYAHAIADFLRS